MSFRSLLSRRWRNSISNTQKMRPSLSVMCNSSPLLVLHQSYLIHIVLQLVLLIKIITIDIFQLLLLGNRLR